MAAGQACKPIFQPIRGLKDRTFDSSEFSAEGDLKFLCPQCLTVESVVRNEFTAGSVARPSQLAFHEEIDTNFPRKSKMRRHSIPGWTTKYANEPIEYTTQTKCIKWEDSIWTRRKRIPNSTKKLIKRGNKVHQLRQRSIPNGTTKYTKQTTLFFFFFFLDGKTGYI